MKFDSIDELRNFGFQGFQTISDLLSKSPTIPCERGNYMVLYTDSEIPEFVSKGPGGFFKKRDPNVPISTLRLHWVASEELRVSKRIDLI